MKLASTALGTALIAAPALAHDGAHMHPHGYENLLAVGVAAAIAVYIGVKLFR